MVIIKTTGGLGNQLFQYATALEIAEYRNDTVVFDLEFQKKDTRRFELKNFGLKEKLLTDIQGKSISYKFKNRLLKLYIKYIAYSRCENRIIQYLFGMAGVFFCNYNNPDIPSCLLKHNIVILAGSFSNEKYFSTIVPDIRKKIENCIVNNPLKKTENMVCVHIRRGDYVGSTVHEVCTDGYYYRAMDEMKKRLGICHFMIFTDDTTYVKEQMKFNHPYTICEEKNTCISLYYMIQCDHYIMSNSTFSWWAQKLNTNEKKVVIVTERWFKTDEQCDLYDDTWIRMI